MGTVSGISALSTLPRQPFGWGVNPNLGAEVDSKPASHLLPTGQFHLGV